MCICMFPCLTLHALMDSSFWVDEINLEWSIVYIKGLLSLNIVLANSADPDEMQHYGAFHLGLHCLPKYPFRSH